jgi:hypothetical protein
MYASSITSPAAHPGSLETIPFILDYLGWDLFRTMEAGIVMLS